MLSPWSEYNQRRMADVTDHHFSTMKREGKPRHPKLVGAFPAIAERSNALPTVVPRGHTVPVKIQQMEIASPVEPE